MSISFSLTLPLESTTGIGGPVEDVETNIYPPAGFTPTWSASSSPANGYNYTGNRATPMSVSTSFIINANTIPEGLYSIYDRKEGGGDVIYVCNFYWPYYGGGGPPIGGPGCPSQ